MDDAEWLVEAELVKFVLVKEDVPRGRQTML